MSSNKTAIFAYGSLVSKDDAARDLGRPVDQVFRASIKNWVRKWSALIDNQASHKRYHLQSDYSVPPYALALNVEPSDKLSTVNGALIEVTAEDLQTIDARENLYTRVEITNDVMGDHPFQKVFIYAMKGSRVPPSAIIPRSYLKLVEKAFTELGDDQLLEFKRNTPAPEHQTPETIFVKEGEKVG